MMIKKKKGSFNDYTVDLSWGQLNAIFKALEQDHADPLADELFAELGWYLENVPGPGEDEDEYKDAKDAEKAAIEGGDESAGGAPNPDLVGQEVGETGEPEGAASPVGSEPPPEEAEQEADALLERPPAG